MTEGNEASDSTIMNHYEHPANKIGLEDYAKELVFLPDFTEESNTTIDLWQVELEKASLLHAAVHSWLPPRATRSMLLLLAAFLPPEHAPHLVIRWGLMPREIRAEIGAGIGVKVGCTLALQCRLVPAP
ncbi:hypothetical protein PC128_g24335 [Phytophthora cactorum]|nr:hypothetical protein PC128_g24335 [Phytophthora cactorum]